MDLLILVPFITSAIMFGVKRLAGLAMTNNGEKTKPYLRSLLVLFSLGGVVAAGFLSGQEIDPNAVSELVVAFLETGVVAYLAHAFYNSLFRK